jgi:hypothetical protein
LPPENRSAWCVAADRDRTGLNGCNYFLKANASRVHLGLGRLDLPPSRAPSVSPNPVAEVAVTNTDGNLSVKLRVPSITVLSRLQCARSRAVFQARSCSMKPRI